jgi:hypothetical protein
MRKITYGGPEECRFVRYLYNSAFHLKQTVHTPKCPFILTVQFITYIDKLLWPLEMNFCKFLPHLLGPSSFLYCFLFLNPRTNSFVTHSYTNDYSEPVNFSTEDGTSMLLRNVGNPP